MKRKNAKMCLVYPLIVLGFNASASVRARAVCSWKGLYALMSFCVSPPVFKIIERCAAPVRMGMCLTALVVSPLLRHLFIAT